MSAVQLPTSFIRNLMAPDKPTDKSLNDIVALVREHYTPKPLVIVQCFRFHSCSQKEGESIAESVAELKQFLEHCQFEAILNHMLQVCLVCGVRDVWIQRRMLAEPDLTFKRALELAQAAEMAEQNTKDLQQPHTVHAIQKPLNKPVTLKCYQCRNTHSPESCQFKATECYFCHNKGHSAKVCHNKLK